MNTYTLKTLRTQVSKLTDDVKDLNRRVPPGAGNNAPGGVQAELEQLRTDLQSLAIRIEALEGK